MGFICVGGARPLTRYDAVRVAVRTRDRAIALGLFQLQTFTALFLEIEDGLDSAIVFQAPTILKFLLFKMY